MMPIISIKVVPHSSRRIIKIEPSGVIKCYLKSSPERGMANDELISFLAKKLKTSTRQIKIISGGKSRNKKVLIDVDIDSQEIFTRLGIG